MHFPKFPVKILKKENWHSTSFTAIYKKAPNFKFEGRFMNYYILVKRLIIQVNLGHFIKMILQLVHVNGMQYMTMLIAVPYLKF